MPENTDLPNSSEDEPSHRLQVNTGRAVYIGGNVETGGVPIKDGNYQLAVRVIMESGQEGAWRYQINLKLQ
jgi:hypothetical protein